MKHFTHILVKDLKTRYDMYTDESKLIKIIRKQGVGEIIIAKLEAGKTEAEVLILFRRSKTNRRWLLSRMYTPTTATIIPFLKKFKRYFSCCPITFRVSDTDIQKTLYMKDINEDII